MAAGTSLKMKFDTMSGSKTWTFKNAKTNASLANVKALGQAMIDNASFFEYQPVVLRSAVVVTTTEQSYDLDA